MIHDYVSLVKHVHTSFATAYTMQLEEPLATRNFCAIDHTFLQIHSGQISYEYAGEKASLAPGHVLFIPSGLPILLMANKLDPEETHHMQSSTKPIQKLRPKQYAAQTSKAIHFACIHFRTKIFQAFDLLQFLKLPPTLLPYNPQIATNLENILQEQAILDAGTKQATNLYTELLVIALFRHFNTQPWMIAQLLAQQHYFQEERLLKLLRYIHEHLHADLSNNQLASIAHTSEDYIGQYFKKLTGISLQTYIENQRLEEAMRLLRNTNQRIYKISNQVGFIDTAYFCRRFKLKFKVPATKIRHTRLLNAMG